MSPSLQQAHHHPLRAVPFNITLVQAYAPTADYNDKEIEEFYDLLQNVNDPKPKEDILVVQGDWNAKVGKDACGNWQGICGPFCNDDTNERGLRLLEFAIFNDLVLANTLGHHKASRRWTWHSPNGRHHSQIDCIQALPTRSENCQNTKISVRRQRKRPLLADNDLPPSFEKNQQAKTHKTQV